MQLQQRANLFTSNLYFIFLLTSINIYLFSSSILLANTKQVYKCTDSSGNVLFTDNIKLDPACANNAQKQTIKETQSLSSSNLMKKAPNKTSKKYNGSDDENDKDNKSNQNQQKYDSISIVYPSNSEETNSCGGLLDVKIATKPPELYSSDYIQLIIDGSAYGSPTKSYTITTNSLERGPHSITVNILRDGELLQSSNTISFQFNRNCAR